MVRLVATALLRLLALDHHHHDFSLSFPQPKYHVDFPQCLIREQRLCCVRRRSRTAMTCPGFHQQRCTCERRPRCVRWRTAIGHDIHGLEYRVSLELARRYVFCPVRCATRAQTVVVALGAPSRAILIKVRPCNVTRLVAC